MTKTYHGWRDHQGVAHVEVEIPGAWPVPLDLRLDLANHSPTGFEWGYAGSGPAQLALALIADAVGARCARGEHQALKFAVISRLPRGEEWRLTVEEVRASVKRARLYGRVRGRRERGR